MGSFLWLLPILHGVFFSSHHTLSLHGLPISNLAFMNEKYCKALLGTPSSCTVLLRVFQVESRGAKPLSFVFLLLTLLFMTPLAQCWEQLLCVLSRSLDTFYLTSVGICFQRSQLKDVLGPTRCGGFSNTAHHSL